MFHFQVLSDRWLFALFGVQIKLIPMCARRRRHQPLHTNITLGSLWVPRAESLAAAEFWANMVKNNEPSGVDQYYPLAWYSTVCACVGVAISASALCAVETLYTWHLIPRRGRVSPAVRRLKLVLSLSFACVGGWILGYVPPSEFREARPNRKRTILFAGSVVRLRLMCSCCCRQSIHMVHMGVCA